jgi:hypothetical protein
LEVWSTGIRVPAEACGWMAAASGDWAGKDLKEKAAAQQGASGAWKEVGWSLSQVENWAWGEGVA